MSKNLEIEFKTLLTATDYHSVCKLFQLETKDFHTQTNVYFDNEMGVLKKERMGLRIRVLETHAELTLKTPVKDGLMETTDDLTLSQAKTYLLEDRLPSFGAVHDYLQTIHIDSHSLKSIGRLTTKRAEFPVLEGLLAIDESWYGESHDYELELEVTDYAAGKIQFRNLLSRLSLTYQPAKNKIQRMLEASQ